MAGGLQRRARAHSFHPLSFSHRLLDRGVTVLANLGSDEEEAQEGSGERDWQGWDGEMAD